MTVAKFLLEGILTLIVTITFSLVFGLFIWFLWPVIVTAIPGLEGIVATNIAYVDGVGISLLLSIVSQSFKE
tara:strand:- start:738 stop:953 length:216 start_codon:yes stop_codon:yes gene_type:complete